MAFSGSLDEQFAQAQEDIKKLTTNPGNEAFLKLYALYKQATLGDASGKRPGFSDMRGRAKFDAWAKMKGTSSEAAKQQYIDYVISLRS